MQALKDLRKRDLYTVIHQISIKPYFIYQRRVKYYLLFRSFIRICEAKCKQFDYLPPIFN
jgi:hypothetical protein